MSGFEIIGVVLGGLPLLISAAEHYKKGFEPLLKWRHFRYEFCRFINDVDIERLMFDARVNQLLQYTDLSEDQKQALLMGQDPDGWRRTGVKDALRKRLDESYDACISLLGAIEQDFVKLEAMMLLKDGSIDWAKPGQDKWNYQIKRISHSFSRKGPRIMASLGEKNRKFKELLDMLDRKTTPRQNDRRKATTRDTTWARIFESIRRQVSCLHSALRNGWRCGCEVPHLAALQLQQRATGDWSSRFIMKFAPPTTYKKPAKSQCKVLITVIQPKGMESPISTTPQPTPIQETPPTTISLLRPNFETFSLSETHPKALQMHSNSHAISAPTPFSITSVMKTTANSASSSTTQLVVESTHQSVLDFWRSKKPKKTVRMNVPQDEDLKNYTQTTVSTNSSTLSAMTDDLTPSTQEISEVDSEIEDLCSTLETSELSGFLTDNHHRHYQLRFIKNNKLIPDTHKVISLEKLLDPALKPSLSRKQRFRLTAVLASSLLQLETTPWLTGNLKKKDIFFECHEREVFADQPYIHHLFLSSRLPSAQNLEAETQKPTIRSSARISLIHLGILLLELCFGEPIESRTDLRINHLIDGKAHDQTDYLTALEWVSEVEEEAGPDFQGVVKCCLILDVNKPNWTDTNFTQSIYAGVVQPLERIVEELGWVEESS